MDMATNTDADCSSETQGAHAA